MDYGGRRKKKEKKSGNVTSGKGDINVRKIIKLNDSCTC